MDRNGKLHERKDGSDYPLLPLDGVASPCGLIAKSLFNDTYILKFDGDRIPIAETDISWPND